MFGANKKKNEQGLGKIISLKLNKKTPRSIAPLTYISCKMKICLSFWEIFVKEQVNAGLQDILTQTTDIQDILTKANIAYFIYVRAVS